LRCTTSPKYDNFSFINVIFQCLGLTVFINYGWEIWGFGNNDVLEKVHLKFCKMMLNLKTSTPNYMIYGELGRYPVEIDIKIIIISFWAKIICGKQSKI
jgi:hypothetical protein